jgi:predicted regulator of Ras-like GTPase activity (Roadblock/LC7/MglB family)
MNIEAIRHVFEQIRYNLTGIDRLLLITEDGFPIVSTLASGEQEGRTTAMGAILCDAGERGIRELELGQMEAVINVGSNGYFITCKICDGALLILVAGHHVPLGLALARIKKAKPELLRVFQDFLESGG